MRDEDKIVMIEMETRSYSFHAFGHSEEHAMQVLKDGWKVHQKQTDATFSFEQAVDGYGVTITEVYPGLSLRDHEILNKEDTCHTQE